MTCDPSVAKFEGQEVETSIPARFAAQVVRHAARLAVSTASFQWTYSQLDEASNLLADAIDSATKAARPKESLLPVALLMDHDAPLIAAIVATLKTGRPYVVLDPSDIPLHRRATFTRSTADLLIADSA